MTAEQIKKLAAAGLTVEQIAAVAEIMESRNTSAVIGRDCVTGQLIREYRPVEVSYCQGDEGQKADRTYPSVQLGTLSQADTGELRVIYGETGDGTKIINCPNCGRVDIPAVIGRDCVTGQLIHSDGEVRGPTYAEQDEGDAYP